MPMMLSEKMTFSREISREHFLCRVSNSHHNIVTFLYLSLQGVPRLIADVDFELQTNGWRLTDLAYLGFCLRQKLSIYDHWSSHTVKQHAGGQFEMEWKKLSVFEKTKHENWNFKEQLKMTSSKKKRLIGFPKT